MNNDYYDFLNQIAKSEHPANTASSNDGYVNLTTRADAECQVVCDGDFLFLLNPNQITKEKAPAGQHILQFISTEYPDLIVEKVVDFPEVGKNYLVMVNEFCSLISAKKKSAKEVKDASKKKVNPKANKNKADEDPIVSVSFTAKLGGKGTYTGHLKDKKPEGKGIVVFESGSIYEGEFKDGWRHGFGTFKMSDGFVYEGEFKEDMRTGKGRLISPDGRIWEGNFLNGQAHGKIRFHLSGDFKGHIQEGIWENGEMANKPNNYFWPNGDRLECEGWDGGSHGKGVYYRSNGTHEAQVWSHGTNITCADFSGYLEDPKPGYALFPRVVSEDNVTKDEMALIRKAAELGNSSAAFVMYVNLRQKNEAEATKWLQKASEAGYPLAQYFWGRHLLYEQEKGKIIVLGCRLETYSTCIKWFEESAKQGCGFAQDELGDYYFYEKKVGSEAVKWYRKAAEKGIINAWVMLGRCYSNGVGVEKDYQEACKWYKKAADKDDGLALKELGIMYMYGRGVNKSQEEAKRLLQRAVDAGQTDARMYL